MFATVLHVLPRLVTEHALISFFNIPPTADIYTLSLHDALPIFQVSEVAKLCLIAYLAGYAVRRRDELLNTWPGFLKPLVRSEEHTSESSHVRISYAVFCLKKKNTDRQRQHGLDQL